MIIALGIETSCDETAVALVGSDRRILAQTILSQIAEHRPYGGVVPEIAARNHLLHLLPLIQQTLQQAHITLDEIDLIAATAGPGLIGGLIVGLTMAKAIAAAKKKPLIGINHLEGHALTARLTEGIEFPYLLLLVSGGHCQLLLVKEVGEYQCLGTTLDDALGEAFDKVAKMLGLGFPGGPAIEVAAKQSAKRLQQGERIQEFPLPRPMVGRAEPNFSFSGLKTAVYQQAITLGPVGTQLPLAAVEDLAAAFQQAAIDCIIDRVGCALKLIKRQKIALKGLVAAGGVASNQFLRTKLQGLCQQNNLPWMVPPPALCTDNAAMIAWAGLEWFQKGRRDGLDILPRPRWPLDPNFTVSYG